MDRSIRCVQVINGVHKTENKFRTLLKEISFRSFLPSTNVWFLKYQVYGIEVSHDCKKWMVERRYKECQTLNSQVRKTFKTAKLAQAQIVSHPSFAAMIHIIFHFKLTPLFYSPPVDPSKRVYKPEMANFSAHQRGWNQSRPVS